MPCIRVRFDEFLVADPAFRLRYPDFVKWIEQYCGPSSFWMCLGMHSFPAAFFIGWIDAQTFDVIWDFHFDDPAIATLFRLRFSDEMNITVLCA